MAIWSDRISIHVSIWNRFLSIIIRSSFNKRLKDRIRLSEVVVNNVHEERSVKEGPDEIPCRRALVIEIRPLLAELIRFIFPGHKANRFHDRGLDDLFTGEHTPRHGVWTFGVSVRAEVAGFVDYVVGDVHILLYPREEDGQ